MKNGQRISISFDILMHFESVCFYHCEFLVLNIFFFLKKPTHNIYYLQCCCVFLTIDCLFLYIFLFSHLAIVFDAMSIAVDVHSNEHQRHIFVCLLFFVIFFIFQAKILWFTATLIVFRVFVIWTCFRYG